MANPLNRQLYDRLVERFGSVKISNEGESFQGMYVPNSFHGPGQPEFKLNMIASGEQYMVCCPLCNDTRHRLAIGHRYGVRDEMGRRNFWMVICYNEDCYDDERQRWELWDDLNRDPLPMNPRILPGTVIKEAGALRLPGPHFTLDRLAANHPARVYLADRGYDPVLLGRYYKVGYCPMSVYYLARNRIIAPVFFKGRLRGWQARYIGDLDWHNKEKKNPPKWYSAPGMDKSLILLNYDNAVKCRTGVVVEGPADVWAVGPQGMATLGSSCSAGQIRHLVAGFRGHTLIVLWDPDVRHDAKKLKHMNRAMDQLRSQLGEKNFLVVWLPDGTDPGKLDRAFLHSYIEEAAAAAGVRVSWGYR